MGIRLHQLLGFIAVGAGGVYLLVTFLASVQLASELEVNGPCLGLDAKKQDRTAPDFALKDLSGKTVRLADLRGKTVLLNFWATWCPPCVEELPDLVRLAARPPVDDFVVLTVSVDEDNKTVADFLAKNRGRYAGLPVLMDSDKKTAAAYGTSKFPETYLIDKNGRIRHLFINKRAWSSADARACLARWADEQ